MSKSEPDILGYDQFFRIRDFVIVSMIFKYQKNYVLRLKSYVVNIYNFLFVFCK
jgi:hypothetical protein